MTTISTIFADRPGPYSKAFKVKVVAVKEAPAEYYKDGVKKTSLASVVSDGETLARVTCYDPTKYSKFRVGNTLLLREIIRKKECVPLIVVTRTSKVLISAPIEIPSEHQGQAAEILNPPPAEKVPIVTALASPPAKRTSVEGKIIQEDEPRTVDVRGEEVRIKMITIEDRSGKAKVSLWRATAETEARPGDHVVITDVVINRYNNATSLSTTGNSAVKPCDAPVIRRRVTVEAVGVEGGVAELFIDDDDTIKVPAELLQQALSEGGDLVDVEMMTVDGAVSVDISLKGNDVIAIEKV